MTGFGTDPRNSLAMLMGPQQGGGIPQQGGSPLAGPLIGQGSQLIGGGEGGGIGSLFGAGGEGGGGGLGGAGPAGLIAALIGMGKNTEYHHPNTVMGDTLLAGLAPSGAQIAKDPMGMGLPTALGAAWATPFFASDESKATKPEWNGLFSFGF